MKIPTLAQDKANHFMWGAVLYPPAMVVSYYVGLPGRHEDNAALMVGIVAIAKEASDRLINLRAYHAGKEQLHGVEWKDVAATVGGALADWVGVNVWVALAANGRY